jgi:2-polyprenyl-3-methyl-5-hydroxy-6-metoxy-1,4-benzoquinol methylase
MFSCRACQSSQIRNIFSFGGFPQAAQHFLLDPSVDEDRAIRLDIVECKSCSLVQITNPPVSYYRDVITAASLNEVSKKKLIDEWLLILNQHLINKGQVLEVGSGRGDFLEVLIRLGFNPCGVENSIENVKIATDRGLLVKQGYFLDLNFINNYPLIVCNNYLEHQPDVGLFVEKMYEALVPDGIAYVSVPNLAYLLDKACVYEFVADHLVYFTQNSLRQLFSSKGFEILQEYEKNNGNDLVIVARKRKKIDYPAIEEKALKIIGSVKNLVKHYHQQGKSIVVWGAGHRALALMAMANVVEIDAIVDSASFKQGKYSPILHKKIISPEDFFRSNYDVLILMLPGAFNDQVASLIESKKLTCKVIRFNDLEISPI